MARLAILLALSLIACGKSDTPPTSGSGSAKANPPPAGSGSSTATTGSGSAAPAAGSGSGSATASAGSNAGSGSAAAGSGSGSGSAVAAGSGSGSGSGSAAAPPDDGFHFDVTTTLKDKTFEQLGKEEQAKFMKENVVPQMKKEFQAFDGKKYANFGCATCHGKDFKEKKFKMPNPDLPKLDFAKLEKGEQKPKMAKFMGLHTKPDMAKILNLTPYDEQHKDGFGCLHCHEQKK
jgi:hypothetical protein